MVRGVTKEDDDDNPSSWALPFFPHPAMMRQQRQRDCRQVVFFVSRPRLLWSVGSSRGRGGDDNNNLNWRGDSDGDEDTTISLKIGWGGRWLGQRQHRQRWLAWSRHQLRPQRQWCHVQNLLSGIIVINHAVRLKENC